MRILHVAETAQGGVGTHLAELLPRQAAALGSDRVHLVVPGEHAGHVGGDPGLMTTFRRGPARSLAGMRALVRAVSAAIEAGRPDVLHVHSSFAGAAVRAAWGWRRQRPAIVYCPHGWGFDRAGSAAAAAAFGRAERLMSLVSDRIVAVSAHEALLARRIGIGLARIDVIPNGLSDLAAAAPAEWRDPRLKVLFVGRLDRQKGLDTLLDAAAPLDTLISLRIAGAAIADPGIVAARGPAPQWLGWLSHAEVRAQVAAADVIVVPSRWEAFGLVALDAMRAGKVVIASHVGGLAEIVRHGSTGWLVPPGSPAALGRAIASAVRADRQRMGAAGRDRFLARYTADRMHHRVLALYDRVAAARRAA